VGRPGSGSAGLPGQVTSLDCTSRMRLLYDGGQGEGGGKAGEAGGGERTTRCIPEGAQKGESGRAEEAGELVELAAEALRRTAGRKLKVC
jgi:hypothetical protein